MTYGRVEVTAPALVVLAIILLTMVATIAFMLGVLP